jgi:histidine kinase
MMLNSRDEINQIINNIGRQPEIKNIRIYNKNGEIKYSNNPHEVEQTTNIKAEACHICHRTTPPVSSKCRWKNAPASFYPKRVIRLIGIISPIGNEPGCSTGDCHVHPQDKKVSWGPWMW